MGRRIPKLAGLGSASRAKMGGVAGFAKSVRRVGQVPFLEVLAQALFITKKTAPDDFVTERNDGAFFYPTKYYFS